MRLIFIATAIAAALAGSSAFAQSSYVHHAFCLLKAGGQECAYDSMAQCEASKTDNTQTCQPNSPPQNH